MTRRELQTKDARKRLLAGLPVAERRLQLAGVSTAALEGGNGSPIVLLHVPGESAFWWMRVIPDLVTTHRVIVPDLPGHGASVVADNALDAYSVIAWLGELIEQTCPTPPTLVGHLLGGAIAARFPRSVSGDVRWPFASRRDVSPTEHLPLHPKASSALLIRRYVDCQCLSILNPLSRLCSVSIGISGSPRTSRFDEFST